MFSKYKIITLFILKFFVVYIVLTVLYQYYLSAFQSETMPVVTDSFTVRLSEHVAQTGTFLGFDVQVSPNTEEPSMRLLFNQKYVARIVEGCNAIAVMILFLSFIVAFSGNVIETIAYSLFGIILLYTLNIFRILSLGWALWRYPAYADFLHQIFFPLVIYGFTFLLWIIWVKNIEKQSVIKK